MTTLSSLAGPRRWLVFSPSWGALMALNLVLVQQRQSARGIGLSWTPLEGASAHQVFVACRRLLPEELEAAASVNGTAECFVAKVGGDVTSVIDDITPPGEARHYGVAMVFADGTVRPARFRTLPEGGRPEWFHLSELNRAQAAAPPPAPPQASAPTRAPGPVPRGARLVRRAGPLSRRAPDAASLQTGRCGRERTAFGAVPEPQPHRRASRGSGGAARRCPRAVGTVEIESGRRRAPRSEADGGRRAADLARPPGGAETARGDRLTTRASTRSAPDRRADGSPPRRSRQARNRPARFRPPPAPRR